MHFLKKCIKKAKLKLGIDISVERLVVLSVLALHIWIWGYSEIALCRSSEVLSDWMRLLVDRQFQVSRDV